MCGEEQEESNVTLTSDPLFTQGLFWRTRGEPLFVDFLSVYATVQCLSVCLTNH